MIIHHATPQRTLDRLQQDLAKPRGKRSLSEHLRRQAGIDGAKAALLFEGLDRSAWQDPARVAAASAPIGDGGMKVTSCARAFARRAASPLSAPSRTSIACSARRRVPIISGPSVEITIGMPAASRAKTISAI